MSDSVRPHRWQPTRLPHSWDSPGKNTGVGCHFLPKPLLSSMSRDLGGGFWVYCRQRCSAWQLHGSVGARENLLSKVLVPPFPCRHPQRHSECGTGRHRSPGRAMPFPRHLSILASWLTWVISPLRGCLLSSFVKHCLCFPVKNYFPIDLS